MSKIIKASLDEIVEAVMRRSHALQPDLMVIEPSALRTALEKFVVEEEIPFDKALDRASLNAFDRMEFIKGANWAKGFLTTPKKGGDDEA